MRDRFIEQLSSLHKQMIVMGNICEEAISLAVESFSKHNPALIDKVIQTESEIDRKEKEIESLCMKLLLQQQPVAADLRVISSALGMITDMERIGDQALDISEAAKGITIKNNPCAYDFKEMATEAVTMVARSVETFVKSDLDIAAEVITSDDKVDKCFDKIKSKLIEAIASGNSDGKYFTDLLMIAKYLERIADHATNIAQWVEYSITGIHYES